MSYLSHEQIQALGFKKVGKQVKISERASIYNHDQIELGDYARIDDFCVVSGKVHIGAYCHLTPMCLVAGGLAGIHLEDFCTLAYGVKVFAQTDDYSGETMVNSLIPKKYKNERIEAIYIKRHTIIGTNAVIMPGVTIEEGCSIGAGALVNKSLPAWGIYVGSPARRLKDRSQALLALEKAFLLDQQ